MTCFNQSLISMKSISCSHNNSKGDPYTVTTNSVTFNKESVITNDTSILL